MSEVASFSAQARADLNAILAYVGRSNPGYAPDFVARIERRCDRVARHPTIGRQRPEIGTEIRSLCVGRYVVFYRIIDAGIEIIRVLSGERDLPAQFRDDE